MATTAIGAEPDDDITEDDASFPLTFAPEVEEAIATVIYPVPNGLLCLMSRDVHCLTGHSQP